eukprot:2257883-Pyramimonas_sp.AAC.1
MSPKLKGLLLEEGACLSAQGLQNLRTLALGKLDYENVSWALKQMDSGGTERLLPGRGAGAMLADATASEGLGASEALPGFQSPLLSPPPPWSQGRSE